MKTYLIPVTNSYEYDYCNYVIVKSETASDAYHAALNISEVKGRRRNIYRIAQERYHHSIA